MLTTRTTNATGKRFLLAATALAIVVSLSGCGTSKMTTGSISRQSGKAVNDMSSGELRDAGAALGESYTKNPNDKATAMRYSTVLQLNGKTEQSLTVMRKLAIAHPTDYPDWKLLSAEAAILDQLGQPGEARNLYRRALDLKPNEPSVLSNLGMSYVLEGDLKTAETYMRTASEQSGADSRVRQNLALVVGLQGRFEEAEKIASHELSPDQAEANVTYLRSMLAQQNAWNQLKDEDKPNTN